VVYRPAPGGGGNYKVSIVDPLKLLELDSSLAARKKLAAELTVHAGEHGSAEQNITPCPFRNRAWIIRWGEVPSAIQSDKEDSRWY
jgi:hypothetical protein